MTKSLSCNFDVSSVLTRKCNISIMMMNPISTAYVLRHHRYHQPINIPTAGLRPSIWITHMSYHPPRGPSARWWVLTTANEVGTNGLTCLSKHVGARNNKFLVTHPMTDQCCLTSAITRRSALFTGPSSTSSPYYGD
jgi:hypothetical protein